MKGIVETALVPHRDAWYTENTEGVAVAQVLTLVDDLFFQAKMTETARQLSIGLQSCTTADALLAEARREIPRLIIVDLNARHHPIEAVERICAAVRDVPLVAFLSHVETDLAERARAAGCHEVMPRSQFTRNLATILSQVKSESP